MGQQQGRFVLQKTAHQSLQQIHQLSKAIPGIISRAQLRVGGSLLEGLEGLHILCEEVMEQHVKENQDEDLPGNGVAAVEQVCFWDQKCYVRIGRAEGLFVIGDKQNAAPVFLKVSQDGGKLLVIAGKGDGDKKVAFPGQALIQL